MSEEGSLDAPWPRQHGRGPGLMSLTILVPLRVPSLRHSSLPCLRSPATKKSVPATSLNTPEGSPPVDELLWLPGLMSFTSTAP